MLKIKFIFTISLLSVLIIGCSGKDKATGKDPITGKKKRFEVNIDKKTDQANEEGGLFGSAINNQMTFEFASSNVLWRASLATLDFIPLNNVDYSGGVIVSDWYAPQNSNESVKITVRFLSSELKPSSVQVKSFKKVCAKPTQCITEKSSANFNSKIKKQIFIAAKETKIKDEQKKLKK